MKKRVVGMAVVGVMIAVSVCADQARFVGARATGMGGANAAAVKDATALWHNPAAFGFMNMETNSVDNNALSENDWGWNILGLGLGYNMTADLGRYLDIVTDIDFNNLSENAPSTPEQVRDLVAIAAALRGVSEAGNTLYVDSSVATALRVDNVSIGFRVFNEAAIWVDELDTVNLGLDTGAGDLNAAISNAAFGAGPFDSSSLSVSQRNTLLTAGLDSNNVDYIDYQIEQLLADGTLEQSDVDAAADLLADIVGVTEGGGGALSNNTTTVAARGFAVAEIPIGYGHAFNQNFSVGVTAKAMFGRVLGTKVWVFDEDNLDEAYESVSDTESDTVTFGLDLAAMYRIKGFQFAAVGRNLNSPTFDGYTDTLTVNGEEVDFDVPDVTLDPQVTLAAAFIPSKRLTLEVDYDLFTTGTLISGYDIQRLSFGAEVDFSLFALRGGLYKNLAESDEDWVFSGGLGLNAYLARIDIGGAVSIGDNNAEYDGNEIPSQARLYAEVGMQF